MVINLSVTHSLVSNWIGELRHTDVQTDRMRFRKNLERTGEVIAYEISKTLEWEERDIPTPLGISVCKVIKEQPILATILRAGLPLHQGVLNYFDKADNAFGSAYRKHHRDGSFDISIEYVSCPDLDNRVLIISYLMLATGASLVKTLQALKAEGQPKEIQVVSAIACTVGMEFVRRAGPALTIGCGGG